MKKILLSAAALLAASSAFAGGYLTNTNQSVAFLRNPARLATFELDGAYSNPAGLAWLGNGWHFGLNIQNAAQTREINSTYAPFAYNINHLGQASKNFKGEATAPVVPSFDIAYQKDNWTISTHFGITGGGGKATFNDGLPMFESSVAYPNLCTNMVIDGMNQVNSLIGMPQIEKPYGYQMETYMSGRQYIFGLQAGLTYKIFDNLGDLKQGLSAHLGARMNFASNAYEGYLRNLNVVGAKGNKFPLQQFIGHTSNDAAKMSEILSKVPGKEVEAAAFAEHAKTLRGVATQMTDKELDCDQKGWGIAPIIGLDYRIGEFNLGMRYEFMTEMNIENKTKVNSTGIPTFSDGVNTPNDIPAILSIGGQYNILNKVRVMAGWNCYFDKKADMGGKEKTLNHNTHEITAGVEWDINDRLTVSGGYQNTDYGTSDAFQSDLSFHCDSYSLGFGAKMKIRKNLAVEIAYFWTNYKDYDINSEDYFQTKSPLPLPAGHVVVPGKDVFSRTNRVFGLGISYSL